MKVDVVCGAFKASVWCNCYGYWDRQWCWSLKEIESQRNKKRWWLLIDAAKFIDPYEGDKKVTVEFKTRIRLVTRKMSTQESTLLSQIHKQAFAFQPPYCSQWLSDDTLMHFTAFIALKPWTKKEVGYYS